MTVLEVTDCLGEQTLAWRKNPQCSFHETLKMSWEQLINNLSAIGKVGHMCPTEQRLVLIFFFFLYYLRMAHAFPSPG